MRKGKNKGFDNVKHLLLTANGVILHNAHTDSFLIKGDVPKATNLDFLMNKFWFDLNKGFGQGAVPKTLNIISRAQIALSYLADDKISKIYEEVKQKYKEGEISDTEAVKIVAELRSYSKTPDEIDCGTIDEMNNILEYEVTARINEIKREEIEKKQDKERIENLEDTIKSLQESFRIESETREKREEENKKNTKYSCAKKKKKQKN